MFVELNYLIFFIRFFEIKILCDEEFFCNLFYEDMIIFEYIYINFVWGVVFYIKNNLYGYGGFLWFIFFFSSF